MIFCWKMCSTKRDSLEVRSRAIREMDGDLHWTILKVSCRNPSGAVKAASGIPRAQIETDEVQHQSLKLPRRAPQSRDVVDHTAECRHASRVWRMI